MLGGITTEGNAPKAQPGSATGRGAVVQLNFTTERHTMKNSIARLQEQASKAANWRGHTPAWGPVDSGQSRELRTGACIRCPAWVQINTCPAPNQIDIGGPAVALDCPAADSDCN